MVEPKSITGNMLKESREGQKLSITEVSMAIKISPKVLNAIENGDREKLPAVSYIRGFVRTYSGYLKLDVGEVVQTFNDEYTGPTPEQKAAMIAAENEESNAIKSKKEKIIPSKKRKTENSLPFIKESGSKVLWWTGASLFGLLVIIFFLNSLVEKYSEERETEQIANEVKTIAPLDGATPEQIEGAAKSSGGKDEIAQKPTPDKVKPAVEQPVAAVEPPKKEVVEPVEPVKVKEAPVVSNSAPQEVILESLDQVKISFTVNDEQMKHLELGPDQIHTIKLVGVLKLDLSDGGAVNLIVNGRDKGVPGDLGKPMSISIP